MKAGKVYVVLVVYFASMNTAVGVGTLEAGLDGMLVMLCLQTRKKKNRLLPLPRH